MNRHLFRTLLLLLAFLVPSTMAAATQPMLPDFSRAALLRIFGDFYAAAESSRLEWTAGSNTRVRFAPVVLPLLYDSPHADLMPPVSPFALMNAEYPATRSMVAVDDRNVATAIQEIEARQAKAASRK